MKYLYAVTLLIVGTAIHGATSSVESKERAAQGSSLPSSSSSDLPGSRSSSSTPPPSTSTYDLAATQELWKMIPQLKFSAEMRNAGIWSYVFPHVKKLIDSGRIDVNMPGRLHGTFLSHLIDLQAPEKIDLIRSLIAQGANASTEIHYDRDINYSPLIPLDTPIPVIHYSIMRIEPPHELTSPTLAYDTVNALLADNPHKASLVNLTTAQYPKTPLFTAIEHWSWIVATPNMIRSHADRSYLAKIQALLDNGADIDAASLTLATGEVLKLLQDEQKKRKERSDAITAAFQEGTKIDPLSKEFAKITSEYEK